MAEPTRKTGAHHRANFSYSMVISDSDAVGAHLKSHLRYPCRPRQYRETPVFPSFAVRRRHCECQRQKGGWKKLYSFSTQFESECYLPVVKAKQRSPSNFVLLRGACLPNLRWHGRLSAKVTKNANLGYSHDRGLS